MLQVQNNDKSSTNCLIAVGSNLPSPLGSVRETVTVALELLTANESIKVTAQSRLFQTPAYPPGAGPDFVNGAISVATELSAGAMLDLLHDIEFQMGRTRNNRWEARVLDLDLLNYGDQILPDLPGFDHWASMPAEQQLSSTPTELILPHPRLHNRGFVLVPLADIAPNWRHPRFERTVRQMLADLSPDDLAGIKPLVVPAVPPDVRGK